MFGQGLKGSRAGADTKPGRRVRWCQCFELEPWQKGWSNASCQGKGLLYQIWARADGKSQTPKAQGPPNSRVSGPNYH